MIGWVSKMQGFMGPNVYPEVPDGGWGWVVAVSFFLVEAYTYGIIKSFGIFLQDLMSYFGETNSRVSWIVSICVFVMTFTAPLSSVLCNRFGYQPVVMLGGFLVCLGTITTAFTNSINEMYVTIGIVSGLGYCLTFLPTVTILSHYFSRRRSLVTALASTGEALSVFAFAPAFTALKEHIGWQNCLIVIGVLQVTIIICGALLRPIVIIPTPVPSAQPPLPAIPDNKRTCSAVTCEEAQPTSSTGGSPSKEHNPGQLTATERKALMQQEEVLPLQTQPATGPEEKLASPSCQTKLLDFSVLRDCSFICYSLFGLFATLGFFAPQLYVIELSVSRGIERDKAAFMLSAIAISEIFGRMSIGWILNKKPISKIYIMLICVLLLCVVLVVFTFVTHIWGLTACCVLYGFLFGTVASTHVPMLAEEDVVGLERMSSAAGVYVFIQSFAGLAGPPLGGFLVDITQDYGSAFYSCAIGMGLGALFLGLVRPAKKGQWCRKARSLEDGPAERYPENTF
ncbi:monocarboxylate transporter 7-like [Brienomyrus brachyistius]|uniref:monocarboxylate transporter 7-like n=1 Tax=Brienomyrus brachyistius TaxID=42636 RepID=UPI0020B1A842|nr:monocarboxylate transporter 7-like [Brienomyrus brachyistius]XP_048870001.1 monocarboxylate transporter 7-like [Brienomyrus brachyistius]XP_048870002.1 monocarboxylate transporter 7-like [Brienomyrus brachyistius]